MKPRSAPELGRYPPVYAITFRRTKLNEIFTKRFAELADAHSKFRYEDDGMGSSFCRSGQWEGWATSSENLIRAVFGEEAPHYKNFREAYAFT